VACDQVRVGGGAITAGQCPGQQGGIGRSANMATPAEVTDAEGRTGISQELPAATPAQDAYDMSIFGDKAVIAVDQDPLGQQGHIVSSDGSHLIMAKPLANGDVAVTLFNEGSTAATMSTDASAIGLASSPVYTLSNLWTGQVTETGGTISAYVAPHQTVMYRVAVPHGALELAHALANPPATTLTVASDGRDVSEVSTSTTSLTVSLTNNGVTPVAVTSDPGLTAPAGWTIGSGSETGRQLLGRGDTDSVTFPVVPPSPSQPIGSASFGGSVSYRDVTGPRSPAVTTALPFVSPVTAPYQVADITSDPSAAVFGELSGSFAISAAGTGITPEGRHPASDEYATIYSPGGAGTSAVATAQVTTLPAGRGPQAGLIMRNDATGSGPEGVVLYLNGNGQVVMSWASSGGTEVDSSNTAPGAPGAGVWLQLARTGTNTYTGSYSTTSASGPWTAVDSVTTQNAAATQDVGLFASSGAVAAPVTAAFSGFTITG
jgi:hypothetical protein